MNPATTQSTIVDTATGAGDSTDSPSKPEIHRTGTRRAVMLKRALVYGVVPGIALLVAVAAGYLKWIDSTQRYAQLARIESIRVASDDAVALLSYRPETVEIDLHAAAERIGEGAFQGVISRADPRRRHSRRTATADFRRGDGGSRRIGVGVGGPRGRPPLYRSGDHHRRSGAQRYRIKRARDPRETARHLAHHAIRCGVSGR